MKKVKSTQPWDKFGLQKRKVGGRNLIDTFLIVCEGSKTEPNYFRKFPVNHDVIELEIEGEGKNTLSLVDEAIKLRDKGIFSKKRYNQTWVVFDKDSFKDDNYDNAIKKALSHNINVAYSNEAFELWYLLHFEYLNSGIHRNQYQKKLSKYLNAKYQKNSDVMYEKIFNFQKEAIERAKKLLLEQINIIPSKANPSTTVYKLVIELNKFID